MEFDESKIFDEFITPTMGEMELDDSTTHVIIQLSVGETVERVARLVPRLWIAKRDGKWVCLYPQKKDNALIEEWVKESAPPRADFDRCAIEILKEATSFAEGERRLNRIFDNENAESSLDCFANENGQRKRFRNSDNECEESNEALYCEDNSVYTVHSPITVTPDFTINIKSTEKGEKNSSGSLEEYLDKKLQAIEDRIMSKLESMRRSISYELNKKTAEILNTIPCNSEAAILETNDSSNAIDVKLPVENMEQFIKLSQTITQHSEKEKSMKVFLHRVQRGSNSLKSSLSRMLGSTMTKAVQLKFSGQGRKVKGKGKENFSATPLFHCIDDVLSNVFPKVGKAEILSATTRWFSGATDREGGKKLRSMDATILPKSEQIDDALTEAWNFS